jgi:GNAT superfamily N-acetyltransferase
MLLRAQFGELEIRVPEKRVKAGVAGALAAPTRGTFLLGSLGRRVVALAYLSYQWTLEHGGKIAWLEELYVLPELRSLGLGRLLLREALRTARRAGCRAVDLEVEAAHPRPARLYAREGFKRLARRRFYKRL